MPPPVDFYSVPLVFPLVAAFAVVCEIVGLIRVVGLPEPRFGNKRRNSATA